MAFTWTEEHTLQWSSPTLPAFPAVNSKMSSNHIIHVTDIVHAIKHG